MKFISIFFIIYSFLKSLYYGIYEKFSKKNKSGGIAIYFLAILGFILPSVLLLIFY